MKGRSFSPEFKRESAQLVVDKNYNRNRVLTLRNSSSARLTFMDMHGYSAPLFNMHNKQLHSPTIISCLISI